MESEHLIIIKGDDGQHEIGLDKPVYSIGRHSTCDLRLLSHLVSRHHATLVQVPLDLEGEYFYRIIDGSLSGQTSRNGLVINGKKRVEHDLEYGDQILFAPGIAATYYDGGYAFKRLCLPLLDHELEGRPNNERNNTQSPNEVAQAVHGRTRHADHDRLGDSDQHELEQRRLRYLTPIPDFTPIQSFHSFNEPCPKSKASHYLLVEDDQGRRNLTLDQPIYSIGRDSECDICLNSKTISRHHATLIRVPSEREGGHCYRMIDGDLDGIKSTNGVIINGHKIAEHNLENGDRIGFSSRVSACYHRRGNPDDSYSRKRLVDGLALPENVFHNRQTRKTNVWDNKVQNFSYLTPILTD